MIPLGMGGDGKRGQGPPGPATRAPERPGPGHPGRGGAAVPGWFWPGPRCWPRAAPAPAARRGGPGLACRPGGAIALLAFRRRIIVLGAALLMAGTIVGFILARTVGIFGFHLTFSSGARLHRAGG